MANSFKLQFPGFPTYLNKCVCIDTIADLIPVILISMFVLYENNMAYFAKSPLGKLTAILLILYYTSVKITYGLIACSLIVIYYHYENTNIGVINEGFSAIQPSAESQVSADFKTQNCKNGTLVNRGSPVNLEMVEHIYPGINFKNEKCNPCSDTCEFSIIEEQINAEEKLKPKTSDDISADMVLGKITEFAGRYIPSLWVKSEPFALLENAN